jgi:hypothetical protein
MSAVMGAEIEFVGILATSRTTQFALGDPATGTTTWVSRGGGFGGYTVSSYDSKTDTLVLRREGIELKLRLKDDAKVKNARLELTGSITFGATEKIAVERATLLYDQENVFPLKDGLTYRITPTRQPDSTIRYAVSIERVISDNKTETVAAPNITTRPGQPFSVQFSEDLSFTFVPR